MAENFIYRHECEFSSGGGKSEEDFYINNRDTFSSEALLCLQFFLESEWQNFKGSKQAESSCAFIGLLHTGTQKRVTEDGEYEIKGGDLILERESRKVLYTQTVGKEPLRRTGIILYRNTFFDTVAGILFPEKTDVIHCSDPVRMNSFFQAVKKEITEHGGRSEILSQLLFALLQEVYSQKKKREIPEKLRKALEYVERNGFRQISREELSRHTGVSVRLLTELFRKYLNKSPGKYLSDRRIEYAEELLAASRLTVCETARLAGFTSTEYFIREFKRRTGKTPGKYNG